MEVTDELLFHRRLEAIVDPGPGGWVQTKRDVRSEHSRDRGQCLVSRVALTGLDPRQVRPIDAGRERDRCLTQAGVLAQPPE
jgi:hypothetical protein